MPYKKTLYLCDPCKNKECKKATCQIKCKLTSNVKFAKFGKDEKPIIAFQRKRRKSWHIQEQK